MLIDSLPTIDDIKQAHLRIQGKVHRTPVFSSQAINEITGHELFFKAENLQRVGAFKYRGATNALLQLPTTVRKHGVATHSSGNHAAAVARAAREMGIDAHIVMPENAPAIKKKAVIGYGAKIYFCESTQEAREQKLAEVLQATGASFIHPYNNFDVVCGQGTAAVELIEQVPDLDVVMAPVGGGGLLSGTSIATKALLPNALVWAGEPTNASDAWQSVRSGKVEPSVAPNTIADGLRTSLCDMTLKIIQTHVNDILLADEHHIVAAMRLVWERMKLIIEPSSAVPLAALMQAHIKQSKRIGIIISGGNVDLTTLPFN